LGRPKTQKGRAKSGVFGGGEEKRKEKERRMEKGGEDLKEKHGGGSIGR